MAKEVADPKRIVFMGTPSFGVPVLRRLVEEGYDVVAVVTQPDRPSGRGRTMTQSPVKVIATQLGLPVLQPERVRKRDFIEQLRALQPAAIVVAAFGQILPRDLLEMAPLGAINVHGSLLPELRGAAPIAEAIARGHQSTGITIMLMDEGMDTGPILAQRRVDIRPDDTSESLGSRLAEVGADLLVEVLPRWARGEIKPRQQDNSAATYTKPLSKEDGHIDWRQAAEDIERRCRAYSPWPGCYAYWDGKMVKVLRVRILPEWSGPEEPGTVVLTTKSGVDQTRWPAVATGRGALILEELQLEGRRVVTGPEFVRGSRGFIGARLG